MATTTTHHVQRPLCVTCPAWWVPRLVRLEPAGTVLGAPAGTVVGDDVAVEAPAGGEALVEAPRTPGAVGVPGTGGVGSTETQPTEGPR